MNNNPKIRLVTLDDAQEILEIYKPHIDTAVTFEEDVPSLSDYKKRIGSILEDCPFLVCEINNQVVGYAYASEYRTRASYRWNREVTVYVRDGFFRRNIAGALYQALFEILRRQHVANVLAIITLPNEASIKFHESFGFKACAVFNKVGYKLNRWHQVGWWELSFIDDEEQIPQETIPFSSIKETDFVAEIFEKAALMVQN